MRHDLGIDLSVGHLPPQLPGHHTHELIDVAHALDLNQLVVVILQGKAVLANLFLQLLRLLLVEVLLRFFDQRQHVAHAQNAGGHAVGMEGLDHVQLLAGADELDGLARRRADGERRAAPGVAVQLGEQHTVNAQRLVEGGGGVDRVLTGHGVHHQHDLAGLHRRLDPLELVHQRLVDVESSGGIQHHHVVAVILRVANGLLGNLHRVDLPHLKDGEIQLRANHLKLGDGGGAVHVAGHQQRALALLGADQPRQLRHVGGLTGALQAHHHNDAGGLGGVGQPGVGAAHQRGQLLVDDLDDLLPRRETVQNVLPHGLFADAGHKVLDDFVADVRFQQRHAHLAHGQADILLADAALAAQVLEHRV